MRALLLLPVVAGVQVLETHQALHSHVDYEGMKTTLKEIAAARTGDNKIDNSTVIAVRRILETVQVQLMDALKEDLANQQSTFDEAIAAIVRCDSVRNTWFGEPYNAIGQTMTRAEQAFWLCKQEETEVCGHRNTKCNEQDARVSDLNGDMCPYPDFAAGDSGSVNEFMNCFSREICSRYEAYVSGRNTCRGLCSSLSAKTAECGQSQVVYESEYCTNENQIAGTCRIYRMCRMEEETSYYNTLALTRQLESLLQTQREALECLQCYGRAILNHSPDLSECDTPEPCKKLTECPEITYQDPPPFIKCTACSDKTPCGDSFRNYYGDFLEGEIRRQGCLEGHGTEDQCVPEVVPCTPCNVPVAGSGDSECDIETSGAVVPAAS